MENQAIGWQMNFEKKPETGQILEDLKKIASESKSGISKRAKILLVEDDPSNILIESIFLDQCGYTYEIASTGSEVLKKVAATPYALILMNINLPDMNGLAVTRQLREMERQGLITHVPIIAVTAHVTKGYREKCLEAGMNGYIAKPFTQNQLCQKIEQNMNWQCSA
jgi:CheY-like chemotaxis protein